MVNIDFPYLVFTQAGMAPLLSAYCNPFVLAGGNQF